MRTVEVILETDQIVDWESFHEVCQTTFGFPDFYGRTMDAWIDCLTYLNEGDGMSKFHLAKGEIFNINVRSSEAFKSRIAEVFDALVECSASVNERYLERNIETRVSLTFL